MLTPCRKLSKVDSPAVEEEAAEEHEWNDEW